MNSSLTELHSEKPKLHTILAFLSAIGLMSHQQLGHIEIDRTAHTLI